METERAVQRGNRGGQSPSNPRDIELAAFTEAGLGELGARAWDEASAAAEQAWRRCRKGLRSRFGVRNPHWGWGAFALLLAALCAAVAAVLASGFRLDPADTAVAVLVLSSTAATLNLTVLLAVGLRPVNAGFVRPQMVIAIGLGAVAAFQLSRPVSPALPILLAAGAIGLGGLGLVLMVRALRPAEREEIDTAINIAVAEMQPEIAGIGEDIQARVLAELNAEQREHIVALRTRWAPSVDAQAPPGAMIISSFLAEWSPYLKKG